MIDPTEQIKLLASDTVSLQQYREAIKILRELRVEELLRRIGEPRVVCPAEHVKFEQVQSDDYSFRRGWYACIDAIFDLGNLHIESSQSLRESDFGATEDVANRLGLSVEEVEKIRKTL